MTVRKATKFIEMYGGSHREIMQDSPELMFMRAVCAGDADMAASFFREKRLFGDRPPAVDAPNGRFEGRSGIEKFAAGWLRLFGAQESSLVPVIQTRANGRSVTELVVNFVVSGQIEQVPMFVVGELRTRDSLDEVRIYFHFTHARGLTGYRRPIFRSAHIGMGEPALLTGAVREYYVALHETPYLNVDRILKTMGDSCQFGGYEPAGTPQRARTNRDSLRSEFEHLATYMPKWVGVRFETVIDDGVNCVIEWVHIISKEGRAKEARVCLSGISAYERGPDGLLCSIRICDYAHFEKSIDWTMTPISREEAYRVNFVDEFPPHPFEKGDVYY